MENDEKTLLKPGMIFVSGLALGAVAGALLAPDSGKETRSRLRRWWQSVRTRGRGEMTAVKEALRTGQKAYREREKELAGS